MKKFLHKHISDETALDAFKHKWRNPSCLITVPRHMHGGLARWVMWAIPPGSFLEAVLRNDLKQTVACADMENERCIAEWARVMYNYVPAQCQGDDNSVDTWTGILGRCVDCGQPLDVPGDAGTIANEVTGERVCEDCCTHRADQKYASQVMGE